MSLSVCCMTTDPPARVAAMLGMLRDVADEILVAVDSRVNVSEIGALTGVADRIWRFDRRATVDRPRPWLASHCRGDWVLWIDGDEVPSGSLIGALPTLIATTDVLQYHIPRRWLFPDAEHWLEETPWWPDFQIRLIRNDSATMRYGGTHEPILPMLPWRCVEAPLYHLTCLVSSIVERREKVRCYDSERPGMISPGGGAFNEVFQIPEQYASLGPARVPHEDVAAINAVLDGLPPRRTRESCPIMAVTGEEIDAFAPVRALEASDYRAAIEILERDTRFAPGVPRYLLMRVENRGSAVWSWGVQHPAIRLSYHWWGLDGEAVAYEGLRTLLTSTLRPSETLILAAKVAPPATAGRYILEVDLVDEFVRWFDCPTRVEIEVADRWRRP